jgi:hypothetical protein
MWVGEYYMPSLKILGLEAIQAIQCFDHNRTEQGYNNCVRLVAKKETLFRAYVGTDEPNDVENITGSLTVGSDVPCDPINNDQVIIAHPIAMLPSAQTIRGNLNNSLNFKPLLQNLSGSVEITLNVWVKGFKDNITNNKFDFNFIELRHPILMPILIANNNQKPSDADYNASLQGAIARYPVSSDKGFEVNPNYKNINTNRNLRNPLEWERLLYEIIDLAGTFPKANQVSDPILTAIVPNNAGYKYSGFGSIGKSNRGIKAFIVQANLPASFAHEMGHSFEFKDFAAELPATTGEIGMNVSCQLLIPANTTELMSYGGQDRWPSIAFWEKIFSNLSNK